MYPFMLAMNDMFAHEKQKLNHINLFINVSSSLFKKKIRTIVMRKKIDFGL